jgi:cobalamin synthase
MRSLASAIQFLILGRATPPYKTVSGHTAGWFPLVGAALGAAGAGIYFIVPSAYAAIACVAFWVVAGRVPHEGRLLYAAVTLSAVLRWLALDSFAGPSILTACIAAQAMPRAAMVGLAWVSRPAGTGIGYAFTSTLTTPAALTAIAQGILAALLCGGRVGVVLMVGAFLIVRLAREFAYKRAGGVNGDCLGVTEQILEIFVLAVFACRTCSW